MRTRYKVYPSGKCRNRNTRRLDVTTVIQGFYQRRTKIAKPIGKGGKDTPDWGVSSLYSTNVAISDMSELAVRLGAPGTFDRTGNVLFQECFESGLTNWEHNSSPAGAFAVPTARFYSIKPYAIKLHTTADDNSYSGIKRGLPFPYLSRIGFEFHYKQVAAINRMFIKLGCYTGTAVWLMTLELREDIDQIILTGHPNTPNVICDYKLINVLYSPFHVFKIVLDLSTGFFFRLVIDDIDYDISDIPIPTGASSVKAYVDILFYLFSFEESAKTCYIDNIILTTDEPR